MTDRIAIKFFDADGEYAGRYWHHVPRVGDEIMLGGGKKYPKDKAGKSAFKVIRVVWGVEGPNDRNECVNIEIRPAEAANEPR